MRHPRTHLIRSHRPTTLLARTDPPGTFSSCARARGKQALTLDADSLNAPTEARALVSELQRNFDLRSREAAAQLSASRAALDDERQRSLRIHDAFHAQLREAIADREALAQRLSTALAERGALGAELEEADDELSHGRPVAALRESHAALLDKLASLKGSGEWDYERARLHVEEVSAENATLRRTISDLRVELSSVVAWRHKQTERGEARYEDVRALASLRAQVAELRRLQYESERERSALKATAAGLEEELARTQAYVQTLPPMVPRHQREIRALRKQIEALGGSLSSPRLGTRWQ
jgi:predicted  nucleic acid-binding Zn-ribbon protein